MPPALILGASRGIGLEFARQYRAAGWRVIATARSDAGLAALAALGADTHRMDLTDTAAVAGLGWLLDGVALDVAIHNAGVIGPRTEHAQALGRDDFDAVMHANVMAPMMTLPLLLPSVEAGRQGQGGVLAVLSSRMGSIGEMSGSGVWMYRVSKAAVNAALRALSFDAQCACCVALHPGWVRTEMGGANADLDVTQSVAGMRDVLARAAEHRGAWHGGFWNHDGATIGW